MVIAAMDEVKGQWHSSLLPQRANYFFRYECEWRKPPNVMWLNCSTSIALSKEKPSGLYIKQFWGSSICGARQYDAVQRSRQLCLCCVGVTASCYGITSVCARDALCLQQAKITHATTGGGCARYTESADCNCVNKSVYRLSCFNLMGTSTPATIGTNLRGNFLACK